MHSESHSSPVSKFLADVNYDPPLHLAGVSYRTLDVELREVLNRKISDNPGLVKGLIAEGWGNEAAVIATCNRFEIIFVGGQEDPGLVGFFERLLERKLSNEHCYQLKNAAAVRHLYRVAASLDSMVVGEAQILGQIKEAYKNSCQVGAAGSTLHHLFQSAFAVAKRVRNNTAIADRAVSVSYVAVRLAEQIFGDLKERSVLLLGSGQMGELAALHLSARGCKQLFVANRTVERAVEVAARFGGVALSLNEIGPILNQVDIVIGSISHDKPIIDVESVSQLNRSDPLFMIDLGLPRNFSPKLASLDSVYLYNIDDLAVIADENKTLREEASKDAEIIIDYGLLQFERWRSKRAAEPLIVDLRARVNQVCRESIEAVLGEQIPKSKLEDSVEKLTYLISQKLGHDITSLIPEPHHLKELDLPGEEG